jgi:hypothetical protein
MSWVWTVMLSFGNEEYWVDGEDEPREDCQALENINVWLKADDVRQYGPLMDLTAGATGNEVGMSANLYGGGFNHLDIEKFAAVIKDQEWHDPANVQLFIKGEEDEKFTLLPLEDL